MLRLAQQFARLLAPPVCVLCRGEGQQRDEVWGLDLCQWCEAACTALPPGCPRCGEPGPGTGDCDACRSQPPLFDASRCLFRYEDPVDLLITGLKFRHNLAAARVLGMLFAGYLPSVCRSLPDCVIPMPLHASRYGERGFNQCIEIARHLVPRLRRSRPRALPIRNDLLQRIRATPAQSGLGARERAANLQGAFRAAPGAVMPRHIALLDDVMTTGHTASAAAAALKEAGCQQVEIWACARALRQGPPAPIW